MNSYAEFHRFQLTQEKRFQPRILAIFNRQSKQVLSHVKQNGIAATLTILDTIIRPDPIRDELEYLYKSVGSLAAISMNGTIRSWEGRKAGGLSAAFGRALNWGRIVQGIFQLFGAEKVQKIDDTTKEFIRRELIRAEQDQLTYKELSDNLLTSDIPLNRSRLIARTETVGATGIGRQSAAKESRILMVKVWSNSGDKRVRETHEDAPRGVGGESVGLDEPFSNGLQQPGDPTGEAKEVCNCRCVALYQPVRDAQGRLVRVA